MMSRGFKPVGWVAGVAAAALSCYMLSLNVASERAELAKLERSIIMVKKDIRSLETELGTRGRLQQLENWNANVLALSAPTSTQFLDSELRLARFEKLEPSMEERSVVHMAAGGAVPSELSPPADAQRPVRYASAPAEPAPQPQSLVRQASLGVNQAEAAPPVRKAPVTTAAAPVKPVAAKAEAPAAKPKEPVKLAALAKKPEAKTAETKKSETKKPGTKKADAKKAEAKKADAKAPATSKTLAKSEAKAAKPTGTAAKAVEAGSADGQ